MNKEIGSQLNQKFKEATYIAKGIVYRQAQNLQMPLEYTQWRNFEQIIEKAGTSRRNADQYLVY